MNETYEFQGKTVDDAVAEGLIKLGLSREQVDIEVVHKGSRGILGFGSEPARVRLLARAAQAAEEQRSPAAEETAAVTTSITVDEAQQPPVEVAVNWADERHSDAVRADSALADEMLSDEPSDDGASDDEFEDEESDELADDGLTELSSDLLQQMVSLMGYDADVTATWQEPEPGEQERCLILDVNGEGLGSLIGRRGETLSNIQFLLRLMINQKTHSWYNIVVDVSGYKKRRAEQLTQLAMRIADQVADSQRSASLEPMPSNERRIIHMALREHPDVFTQSSGEGERRKVHIVPKS